MTTPDRTDELVRAMLERRAGRPAPPWLLDTVIRQVATAGRTRRRSRGVAPAFRGAGLRALVVVLVLPLGILVGAALASAVLGLPSVPPTGDQALVLVPTSQPSPAALPPAPTASPSASPAPTPLATPGALAPGTFAPDTIAVVTREGGTPGGLRVRTAPGVAKTSKLLEPLLKPGVRMLIVGGPVARDTYDWYQVVTSGDPWPRFGWVASGRGSEAWIEPAPPVCGDGLNARAVVSLDPLDYLACYGDRPVELHASAVEPQPEPGDAWCPWTAKRARCEIEPAWMNRRVLLVVDAGDGTSGGVVAAVPPGLVPIVDAIPETAGATFSVAADSPDASSCRIVDAAGADVVPRERAVAECRLLYVIRGVTSNQ